MNIGGRIVQRLRGLRWERKDLLNRIPDLTPQALSNLIRRDSKRSEWDLIIARELGVSVTWLVYGQPSHGEYRSDLSNDEKHILSAFRAADQEGKNALIFLAKTISPHEQHLNLRAGTS